MLTGPLRSPELSTSSLVTPSAGAVSRGRVLCRAGAGPASCGWSIMTVQNGAFGQVLKGYSYFPELGGGTITSSCSPASLAVGALSVEAGGAAAGGAAGVGVSFTSLGAPPSVHPPTKPWALNLVLVLPRWFMPLSRSDFTTTLSFRSPARPGEQ